MHRRCRRRRRRIHSLIVIIPLMNLSRSQALAHQSWT